MTNQITIHYAMQLSDVLSYQNTQRFSGNDRTLLSKKSVRSLVNSINYCRTKNSELHHFLMIINDNSTPDLLQYVTNIITQEQNENFVLELHSLTPKTGMVDSLRYCYNWLDTNGQDLVFQVQDDYLFEENAIYDSVDQFYNTLHSLDTHAVIQPYNDVTYWVSYKDRPTPRLVSIGKNSYWIQIYDTSCSFLTSHWQFQQNWDLYNEFFKLIPYASPSNRSLENKSLNYMFTQKGILGLTPIRTLSLHMQEVPDPYIDWQILWNKIDIEK